MDDGMDDDDVRRALRKAVMKDETQQRDLIGPAVAIVLRRRRRVRAYGAAGSGLVVAASATAAIWVGAPPAKTTPQPTGSSSAPPTAAATTAGTTTAESSEWDKDHDVHYRLPGVLNPLLPPGLSVTANTAQLPNAEFRLNGPAGNNDFSLSGQPKPQRNHALEVTCVAGGVCSNREVPGGTLYIQTKNFTADYGGASGYAPGTGKQVLTIDAEYEFVPTAADGEVVDVRMGTRVSHEQYAAKPPKDWGDQTWPPPAQADEAFNPSGALLSPDDFLALITKPGFGAVATLLDSSSPVDRSTLDRHKGADATIAAAVKPILPPGLTLTIATGFQPFGGGTGLTLTGPTGANMFSWITRPQQKNWHHGWACEVHTRKDCTWKEVPGGEIEITHSSRPQVYNDDPSVYAPGQANTPYTSGDLYTYLPDDPNGTIVTLSTGEQTRDIPWAATRPTSGPYSDPSHAWPPPARTGEPFNAGGPLISVDEFVAMAQTPGIADVVQTVNKALDPLDGIGLQTY